ncbi:hypothetical protein BAUCODRAFT_78520 [Baudoinia panamericana UAMH 10762]|uniref:Calponin-homology (CH) domain-containing protein n=1 Tax=Baudoinia panamericana (strain UAMH 10762) TaxID=717646 RepID=M2N0J6_BAUPA|nr:uncharacterized protein BAUCODRAFT_78520 [Baudoinia panamericana UAMH 10762]EMC92449.1 hypothetical protein BAUCODRAFT_78520 [Baudoinia panamericana UAMH 10762]
MASVSSLDQDMRNLRLARYTPQAAQEVRAWMEDTLGEQLPAGDLLEALKDGVALCKLVNLALPPPGVKFKSSGMPFIQMENISHFLRACEMPPVNLPAHDRFLTVDLFEAKDPAQVLQCLGAFSRKAHALNPSRFRTAIGPRKIGAVDSPYQTSTNGSTWRGNRPVSPTKLTPSLTGGSTGSQSNAAGSGMMKSSSGPVSSWSKRQDEGATMPAWNIHQYGYMGGASQGNQGISFGARRQITSQAPHVPSLVEKEKKRKEDEERLRVQAEEAEYKRRVEREAEEADEERRWEDETRRLREEERRKVEEQKRVWEEQERRWKVEEEARRKEEVEMQAKLLPKQPPQKPRVSSNGILRGQSLAEYQRESAAAASRGTDGSADELTPEQARVKELERQLEEARERERQYQAEREERLRRGEERSSRPTPTSSPLGSTNRPLPTPEKEFHAYSPTTTRSTNRTSAFLATNPAPAEIRPRVSSSQEAGDTSLEQSRDRDRRLASQTQTKAGGWASKSLLEREMERERERQREWEVNQQELKGKDQKRDPHAGVGAGQSWDVNQYGYTGGDNANRGSSAGSGINFGGRRQIIGPRPLK